MTQFPDGPLVIAWALALMFANGPYSSSDGTHLTAHPSVAGNINGGNSSYCGPLGVTYNAL